MHNKNAYSIFGVLIRAILTALAFCVDFTLVETDQTGITGWVPALFYKLNSEITVAVSGKGMLILVLTMLFFMVYRYIDVNWKSGGLKRDKILAFFFALMYAGGRAFAFNNSLSVIVSPRFNILKSIVLIIGMTYFYTLCIRILYRILHSSKDLSLNWKILGWYHKHPFMSVYIVIMITWSIHIFMRYPGAMSYDNWNQIGYYLGYKEFSTAQPIFHTWLFGTFIKLGMNLGNANIGLFMFVMFQSLIMAAVLSYTLLLMKEWNAKKWLLFLTLFIYCVTPYYTGFAAFPIKDFLFSAGFILWLTCIVNMILHEKAGILEWTLGSLLMILCRNNGIYIYVICSIVLFIIWIMKNRKPKKKLILMVLMLVIPVGISWGTQKTISVCYNVVQNSPAEMLSLPFQQTARYVRDHGDEISEEEKAVISKVLDYDKLSDIYLEYCSDPVKTTYHADGYKDIASYFKVWWKEFLRHPLCYIEATWNQNYYIFMPDIDSMQYNQDCGYGSEIYSDTDLIQKVDLHVPSAMSDCAPSVCAYYKMLNGLPIIGRLSNVAVYIMLIFVLMLYIGNDCGTDKRKYKLAFLPDIVVFLFIIVGPQIQNQPRYAFPIVYSVPLMIAYYMYVRNDKITGKMQR